MDMYSGVYEGTFNSAYGTAMPTSQDPAPVKIASDLPDTVPRIVIPFFYRGINFETEACLSKETGNFRIPHKTLLSIFNTLRSQFPDLFMENGIIDGEMIGTASPAYSWTACKVKTKTEEHPVFFGEYKVSTMDEEEKRNAPFAIALNRAQDKAIIELIGLVSQIYDAAGNPVIYRDQPEQTVADTVREAVDAANQQMAEAMAAPQNAPVQNTAPVQNEAMQSQPVQPAANAPMQSAPAAAAPVYNAPAQAAPAQGVYGAPMQQVPAQGFNPAAYGYAPQVEEPEYPSFEEPSPLSQKELAQLASLGQQMLTYRSKGQTISKKMSECSMNTLQAMARITSPSFEPTRNLVQAYLSLVQKNNGNR